MRRHPLIVLMKKTSEGEGEGLEESRLKKMFSTSEHTESAHQSENQCI